jgi:hypothetical protein
MKVPAELIPLNKWIAYKGQLPERSDKSHTIIIIHKTETKINYFYVTSQIDKARIRYRDDKKGLVEIEKTEWMQLTKKSCVQCGKPHLNCIEAEKLKTMYDRNKITLIGKIPDVIKTKIIQAICDSVTYTNAEKQMYVPLNKI